MLLFYTEAEQPVSSNQALRIQSFAFTVCELSAAIVGGTWNSPLVQADSTSEFSMNYHLEMGMMPKIGALKRT